MWKETFGFFNFIWTFLDLKKMLSACSYCIRTICFTHTRTHTFDAPPLKFDQDLSENGANGNSVGQEKKMEKRGVTVLVRLGQSVEYVFAMHLSGPRTSHAVCTSFHRRRCPSWKGHQMWKKPLFSDDQSRFQRKFGHYMCIRIGWGRIFSRMLLSGLARNQQIALWTRPTFSYAFECVCIIYTVNAAWQEENINQLSLYIPEVKLKVSHDCASTGVHCGSASLWLSPCVNWIAF